MCLEGNKRERGTDRITEPEPERNGQVEIRGCIDRRRREDIPVSDHLVIAVSLTCRYRQLSPDIQPFSGMLVYLLFADFYTDIMDECISDVVHPVVGAIGLRKRGEIDFDEKRRQEIGMAGNERSNTTSEIGVSIEINRDGFNRKGGIATIDMFEECELRIACKIGVLTAAGDQL